jgi:hypothetical protein
MDPTRSWTRPPLSVLVGPKEDSPTPSARRSSPAERSRLGPHVRLETAAEAAMAILGCALTQFPPNLIRSRSRHERAAADHDGRAGHAEDPPASTSRA